MSPVQAARVPDRGPLCQHWVGSAGHWDGSSGADASLLGKGSGVTSELPLRRALRRCGIGTQAQPLPPARVSSTIPLMPVSHPGLCFFLQCRFHSRFYWQILFSLLSVQRN